MLAQRWIAIPLSMTPYKSIGRAGRETTPILAEEYSSAHVATLIFDKYCRGWSTIVCLYSNKELTGCYQAAVPNVC